VDRWGMTGPQFATLVLQMHTGMAHVDAQTCTESDCASVALLRDHPENWRWMDVEQMRAWLARRPAA
jgi:hypothetical protein